jgi:carbonic anhydrase
VQLKTIYQDPGVLLLATNDVGKRLGCVGLRSLGDRDGVLVGEIRRLYVREEGRGQGLGRTLMAGLTDHATKFGFRRLVLNTMPAMHEAVSLYHSLNFESIEPYVDEPVLDTLYMGLNLA